MSRIVALSGAVALALSLGACGYSTGDRALSGGAIGAAGGAALGAIGGNPAAGAIAGGVAGAAAGALTRPDQVNMGKPVWR
ncbi:hypothetical protein [Zavarzinia sp. CC-PAN008]|uniref:hypothetical protein n=1 Tax=Zavarzinia sp. CC-PAN008 TaxID=3243332 RepID=UPI003F742311